MSIVAAIGGLPASVAARLELNTAVPGVELRPVPAGPLSPLDETDILAGVAKLDPPVPVAGLTPLAVLTPRSPWVDGVAWLDFEIVEFYRSGETPLASIGAFHSDPDAPPSLRLTLAAASTGGGNLVTVRAQGIAVGPNFPGYFVVQGPGVAATFVDNGTPTTFTFLVPPGGTGPVDITITTEPDRIRLWAFLDCTITAL